MDCPKYGKRTSPIKKFSSVNVKNLLFLSIPNISIIEILFESLFSVLQLLNDLFSPNGLCAYFSFQTILNKYGLYRSLAETAEDLRLVI